MCKPCNGMCIFEFHRECNRFDNNDLQINEIMFYFSYVSMDVNKLRLNKLKI